MGAGRVRGLGRSRDLIDIAPEIAHGEIELGHLDVQGHDWVGVERRKHG